MRKLILFLTVAAMGFTLAENFEGEPWQPRPIECRAPDADLHAIVATLSETGSSNPSQPDARYEVAKDPN